MSLSSTVSKVLSLQKHTQLPVPVTLNFNKYCSSSLLCIVTSFEWDTLSHIVESCPLTKLNGSLSRLHSADEDAVSWLTSYISWNAYEKKKWDIEACRISPDSDPSIQSDSSKDSPHNFLCIRNCIAVKHICHMFHNIGFTIVHNSLNDLEDHSRSSAVTICQILFPIDKRYDKSKLSR